MTGARSRNHPYLRCKLISTRIEETVYTHASNDASYLRSLVISPLVKPFTTRFSEGLNAFSRRCLGWECSKPILNSWSHRLSLKSIWMRISFLGCDLIVKLWIKRDKGIFIPYCCCAKDVGIRELNRQTKERRNDFVKNFIF